MDERRIAEDAESGTGPDEHVSMRTGLDREYDSMGTGEAGAGVGGGGASSSDVEWRNEDEEASLEREETAGRAMTNEQDFLDEP
jgi:hypothetical protein